MLIDLGVTCCVPDSNLTKCYQEYFRVLKPGGNYFASIAGAVTDKVPNNGDINVCYHNGEHVKSNVSDIANRVFSQSEIEQLLQAFTIKSIEKTITSDRNQQDWVQLYWVHAKKN